MVDIKANEPLPDIEHPEAAPETPPVMAMLNERIRAAAAVIEIPDVPMGDVQRLTWANACEAYALGLIMGCAPLPVDVFACLEPLMRSAYFMASMLWKSYRAGLKCQELADPAKHWAMQSRLFWGDDPADAVRDAALWQEARDFVTKGG